MKLLLLFNVLLVAGCTINVQMVNEFAGQGAGSDGKIVEASGTAETTTPTVDLKAEVPAGAL